jgi:HSP90 family molecular chaperone
LLPSYLRFIKGVVDCEDLPLNISRETYQDTSLIAKLRTVITRRVIKMLEDEAKADAENYNKWYDMFQNFLKEGTQSDPENKDALFKLLRYNVNYLNNKNSFISLEDYMSKMVAGQKKIYFAVGNSYDAAMKSPYYEPFKGKDVPILILSN